MDYSLLIVIEHMEFKEKLLEPKVRLSRNSLMSDMRNSQEVTDRGRTTHIHLSNNLNKKAKLFMQICHLGLIDWLQRYTWEKKAERMFKTLFVRAQADLNISAIEPFKYQQRFMNFVNIHVLNTFNQ
jgi:hypothetical protein